MEAKFTSFLTDTHAHLSSSRFLGDIHGLFQRAKEAEVRRIISVSCDLEDVESNIKLASEQSGIFATAGIHPCYVHEPGDNDWREKLYKLSKHSTIIAIGEIGLDYYHPPQDGSSEKEWRFLQTRIFEEMLQLAQERELPVVVHHRESFDAVLEVLSRFPKVRAVLHCFTGTMAEADRALSAGHYISFTGVLTFPKSAEIREVAAAAPSDRIMLETDSPYLAPVPFRGKTCEPALVRHTALALAEARRVSFAEIAELTSRNAESFFHLSQAKLGEATSFLA